MFKKVEERNKATTIEMFKKAEERNKATTIEMLKKKGNGIQQPP